MVFWLLAFTGKGSFYVIETAEELLERRLAEWNSRPAQL